MLDTSKLAEAIENVNGLAETDYTEATWAVLRYGCRKQKDAMKRKSRKMLRKR